MDVATALGFVVLGGLLGMAGQGARVIVGIRKELTAAAKDPRLKEVADRHDELHTKNKQLTERERELTKAVEEGKASSDAAVKAAGDRAATELSKVSHEKEVAMKEKDMVLRQREALAWFRPWELIISLIIAFVVGGIAGVLASVQLAEEEVTQSTMLTIVAAGYAGTDFIEGFISERLPK